MPEPIYTPDNCHPAYQLRWSLALFARALPSAETWLPSLKDTVERDGVRLLEFHHKPPDVYFFLLSTTPDVSPAQIVKSVKGRLQHRIRAEAPNAFQRNFSVTSVGDACRQTVEEYIAGQLGHHRMADPRAEALLEEFQLVDRNVDLSQAVFSSHGRYVYNLHVVLVHQARWREIRRERLEATRDMIVGVARKKQHRLARLALLADHVHLALGCGYQESPECVALGYLNNLAYAHGMTAVYAFGF